MKRASSASAAAAATAAASQVQPAVNLQGRIHDLFSPITAVAGSASREENEKLVGTTKVLVKGNRNDDAKAKSTTMSRLIAVDSDNYMLRKGASSVNATSVASTSTVVATIVPSNSISNSASSTAISPNLQLYPRQRNFHANLLVITNSGTYSDVQTPRTVSTSDQSPKGSVALSLLKRHSRLFGQEYARLWPNGLFPCARTSSFHQYLCSCEHSPPQQNGAPSVNNVAHDLMAEDGVYSNLAGHENFVGDSGQRVVDKDTGAIRESTIVRNLCCCMCGSLCPPECHACFHVVCSDYSGQHLCQWSSKGHALPGQFLDKDKVSTISRFFFFFGF